MTINNAECSIGVKVIGDQDKFEYIAYLLASQSQTHGYALRHVGSDALKQQNMQQGFLGDAVSYSITKHIMQAVLGEKFQSISWSILPSGDICFAGNSKNGFVFLDKKLAIDIFDCLHQKTLQFINNVYSNDQHHFLLIKDMQNAANPYDVNIAYPTGKCGKQRVEVEQILGAFSQHEQVRTAEELLEIIEEGVLNLSKKRSNKATKHEYTTESTTAILSVLRAIKLNPDEALLEADKVHKRLNALELDTPWDDGTFKSFFDKGGFFPAFKQCISDVNDDLNYFKSIL